MMYSIAIIGCKEAILGFKTLGVHTVFVQNSDQAKEKLFELKKTPLEDKTFAIIFITEDLAKDIPEEDYRKLAKDALPAIIPIPSHHGATGFSLNRLKNIIERAIGSDILNK